MNHVMTKEGRLLRGHTPWNKGLMGHPSKFRKPSNSYKCIICGKKFRRSFSERDRGTVKCCSIKCSAEYRKGRPSPTKGKTRKRSGIYKKCVVCGKEFYCMPSIINRNKCCSKECRLIRTSERKGDKNPNWNGGKIMLSDYVYILSRSHPFKNSGNYVAEHRLVMEKMLGRYLEATEEVHHINGIKKDNRKENLTIVNKNNHYGRIKCPHCNKTFLIK